MRVTVVGLNYPPEVTGIAPYTAGIAAGLGRSGHQVRVICGLPHYPQWSEQPGFRGAPDTVVDGVEVHRVSHFVPNGHSLRGRLRMDLSFGARAAKAPWGQPDLVLAVSPSLLASSIVVARARAARIPVGMIVHDLYGKGAAETGTLARAAGALTRIEVATVRSATGVAVIHDRFAASLVDAGARADRLRVIRNWTHVDASAVVDVDRAAVRERLGWGADETIVLHTGNMGLKQGLENVVDAAAIADSHAAKVRFVLVGDGNQAQVLRHRAAAAHRIEFRAPLDDADYLPTLRAADVLLVNERPGVTDMAVPSKLTSYFASGRPVLAATDRASLTSSEVERSGAGRVVPSGDPQALVTGALELAADLPAAERYGRAGVLFAERILSEDAAISAYAQWCADLVASKR